MILLRIYVVIIMRGCCGIVVKTTTYSDFVCIL